MKSAGERNGAAARLVTVLALLTSATVTIGCTRSEPPFQPIQMREAFYFPARQLAPEVTYNRIREVRPPEPFPNRGLPREAGPRLNPVIHLSLQKVRLDQAAKLIADAARYSSFCSSSIADREVTINVLGTLDELADAVERRAGVEVIIDHGAEQVRILPRYEESFGSGGEG